MAKVLRAKDVAVLSGRIFTSRVPERVVDIGSSPIENSGPAILSNFVRVGGDAPTEGVGRQRSTAECSGRR